MLPHRGVGRTRDEEGDEPMNEGVSTEISVELLLHDAPDLAPEIVRQRLVIEGTCPRPIDSAAVIRYLRRLTHVCGMRMLLEPVTHRSDRFGWAGWVHWEESGAHFYAWEQPRLFFSVDIYACRVFDVEAVVAFTREFFDVVDLVALQF
jgi:S-adenosylmethionine decarboxylase